MTTHQISAATADDVPALVALMMAFYAEAGYSLPHYPATDAFHALLAQPQWGAIWLASDANAPAGYSVLTFRFSMEYGGLCGFVDDLYVLPSARGRGIGSALLSAISFACRSRGVRALRAEVGRTDLVAQKLYERAGFIDSGHSLLSLPLTAPMHANAT